MRLHKNIAALICVCLSAYTASAKERPLKPFSRIIVSPRVNVILTQGETESIDLDYEGVDASSINVEVRGKTLRIYLDEARVTDKLETVGSGYKRRVYEGAQITARITYKTLDHLQIRGTGDVTCNSPIIAERFVLKAYGENTITLNSIKTAYLKTNLYGQNRLRIKGGKAEYQRYKLYGENEIDATRLKSYSSSTTSFGESRIDLNSQDELRITSFGEARVSYRGDAFVSKGLIFGKTRIEKN
jgi:hypothetical protein